MKCYTCEKTFKEADLRCGLCVKRKDNGRYETHLECGVCHIKRWNEKNLEDLKAVANECKSETQLNGAFKASYFVQKWKRDGDPMLKKALEVYNARLQCF